MRVETERKMKRWREQRWLLDQIIQTRGLDWDQGRTGKILRNCGAGVEADIREISRRVQKFTDIPREFSRAAARREELARECYDKFIRFAGRPIERIDLPYEGNNIAALLHLPPGLKAGEKVPCVLYIPGMDGVKEDNPLYGEPFIERG